MERESMEFDVVIVGAGPSGLSAAIRIRQAHEQQILLQKQYPPESAGSGQRGVIRRNGRHRLHLVAVAQELQQRHRPSHGAVVAPPDGKERLIRIASLSEI